MNFFCAFFISYSIVAITFSKAQNQSNSKDECVSRLVETCNKANYSQYVVSGSSVLSTTDRTPSGAQGNIFCLSDANGTSCYLNHSPWFSCSPDHTATYKGKLLSKNSTDDVDEDICYTADKLANGNLGNIFNADVQAILEKNEKRFNRQMADLRDRMNKMNQRMKETFQGCFPFCDHNPFGPGFPFNG